MVSIHETILSEKLQLARFKTPPRKGQEINLAKGGDAPTVSYWQVIKQGSSS